MAAPDPAPQLSKDSSCTGGGVHTWQHPIQRRSCPKILLAPEGASTHALREVLAQQPVGVLVRAALPGAVGIAEVDLKTGVDPQAGVLAHLRPLIPGQRSSQLFG